MRRKQRDVIPQRDQLEGRLSKGSPPSGKRDGDAPKNANLDSRKHKAAVNINKREGKLPDKAKITFVNPNGNIVDVHCVLGSKTYKQLLAQGLSDSPKDLAARYKELADLERATLEDPTRSEGDQAQVDKLLAEAKKWAAKVKTTAPKAKPADSPKPTRSEGE